jgi:hypothetical protein
MQAQPGRQTYRKVRLQDQDLRFRREEVLHHQDPPLQKLHHHPDHLLRLPGHPEADKFKK